MARAALAAGDTAGALESLDRALDKDSHDWEALFLRGQMRLARGDFDKAGADFNRVLFSGSASLRSVAHVGLGDIILRSTTGHISQAVAEYRLATQLDPRNKEALFSLAAAGFQLNDSDGYGTASDALTRLICLDPEFCDALDIWLSRFARHGDEKMRLVADSLEARADKDPACVRYYLYVARCRFRLDEFEAALKAMERLEAGAPDFKPSERELLRSRCRLARGDTLSFVDHYNRALDVAAGDGDFIALAVEASPIFSPQEARRWEADTTTEQRVAFFRAFWRSRDPDPLTLYNERLVTHYSRLCEAEKYFHLVFPHNRSQNSLIYLRFLNLKNYMDQVPIEADAGMTYDPALFFNRNRDLELDQRGLLFLRHGSPGGRDLHPSGETEPLVGNQKNKVAYQSELWDYGWGRFLFQIGAGGGDYLYLPILDLKGTLIGKAMSTDTFRDPVKRFRQDCYGADFQAAGGKVELLYFQSLPQDSVPTPDAPFADLALYDSTWSLIQQNTGVAWPVDVPGGHVWLALNRAVLRPGSYNYALRMDVPNRRAVSHNTLRLRPYPENEFEMSGMVLGARSENGGGVFNRNGVEIHPRPSLRFAPGEKVAVYLEVYGLRADLDGKQEFEEQVIVTRNEKKSLPDSLLPLANQKKDRSLTMIFAREPSVPGTTVPEDFDIDTADLMPGSYSLQVEVRDLNSNQRHRRGLAFEILNE